jgi:hypothetical protein
MQLYMHLCICLSLYRVAVYVLCTCCGHMMLQVVAFQVRSAFPPEVDPLPAHAMDTAVVLPKGKGSRNGINSNSKRSSGSSSSGQSTTAADDATTKAGDAALEQQLEPMQISSDSETTGATADTTSSSSAAVAADGDGNSAAAAGAMNDSSTVTTNGNSSGSGVANSSGQQAKGREMRELDYCGMLNRALPPEIRYV